ncbi:hypothetical protein, conserved [Eimeria maxima]|uniref:Uncharacterized protein n=1 Tax=Eimeria maxima TaxID=5804 RepID=U6M2E8_EIMMA|nr:hypothetical protein, conserved [Eimeria maxima]CDJ58181.1 hypothetical protein, conserved [Eimeria maxima]
MRNPLHHKTFCMASPVSEAHWSTVTSGQRLRKKGNGVACGSVSLGAICLLCEFSPYGLNVLMGVCPLLGEYFFRGVLYILVGFLPLGIDTLGLWGGILMIISGTLNILIHALLPVHPYNFYSRPTSDPEDEEDGAFTDEPDAEGGGALR